MPVPRQESLKDQLDQGTYLGRAVAGGRRVTPPGGHPAAGPSAVRHLAVCRERLPAGDPRPRRRSGGPCGRARRVSARQPTSPEQAPVVRTRQGASQLGNHDGAATTSPASPLARAGRPVHTPGAPTPAVPSARCDAAGHRPPCRRVRPSREDRDVTTAWLRITICWSRPARRSSKPESMTGTAPLLSRVRPRRKHADQRVPTRWLCRSYPYSQDHVAPVLTPRRRRKDWGERATRLPVRRLRKRDVPGVAPARGRYAVLA